MSKRRKNPGTGFGMMFHGAFGDKKAAKKKERQVHGFIQPRNIKGKRRFVVMSERKNPIRRNKSPKNKIAAIDKKITAVRKKLRKLERIDPMSASSWQAAWDRHPDLHAKERELFRQRGELQAQNPSELIVLGANPHTPTPGTSQEIVLPPNSTITIRTNPSAAALREEFVGTPAEWETVSDEPHVPTGDYAQLGELLALYVKPGRGQQVQHISFSGKKPLVVSDESARQIYFVGGDQDVSNSLSVFGAEDNGNGHYALGEVRRIDYKQRKEHVPHPNVDVWRHDFGQESGIRPVLWFDANAKRLLLKGGEYEIRREGIVN